MKRFSIIIAALALGLTTNCHGINNNPPQKSDTMNDQNILSIESFRLEINTMMANDFVYAGEKTDKGFHIEYFLSSKHWDESIRDYAEDKYIVHAIDGDQQLYQEVCTLLTTCQIDTWNGFRGENPPGLLDGSTMKFNAKLCDGTSIYAHGSNNFPKNFRTLEDGLRKLSTCEKITSKNFDTDLYSLTLPDSWVNLVTAEFRESYIAFQVPQNDGKLVTLFIIDESTYDYYRSSYDTSTNIPKFVNSKDEETIHYVDFRDYNEFIYHPENLTEAAKPLIESYEADKQAIIKSFKLAKGYKFIEK